MVSSRYESGITFMPDIREMTDSEIFAELGSLGVVTSPEKFRDDALDVGTPTALADEWMDLFDITEPENEDFIFEATYELWRRHLRDVKCPEMTAEFIDETVEMYWERPEGHNRESLLNIFERIKEFYLGLFTEEGIPDIDLYNEITWHAHNDFEEFFLSVPRDLAIQGLVDEAVSIERWFAGFSSRPENFLRDAGCLLADAGKREEALAQIEENLRRFPANIWIVINAGDAMWSLNETRSAEDFFLKALGIATDKYDKLVVFERLIDIYRETGEMEKTEKLNIEYKSLLDKPDKF